MTSERIVPLSEYDRLPRAAVSADFYKRQLEVVCNNATLALFIMDERQRCVYMNPAAEALTGYRLAETQGRALHDVIHHTRPDGSSYPLCECPIDQVFPQNNREQGEEVFVHKDGHFYPVAYTASPIREGETTIGTIIEVRDITQEKLDEQARQDVKTILSSINDGFYTLDCNWRFTYVNDRYCEMVGMQSSKLLGQNIWELFPAAVHTEAYVQFHQTMVDQTPRQFDYLYTPWNCWHDHRIYPSSTGLTVLIADITDRKQAEAALQKSEERLSLAIDSAGMATWDIDMQTGKGTWSHSHFAMLGYDRVPDGEATYEMWHRCVHPADLEAVMQAMAQARQAHTLYSPEYRIIRADTGEVRWVKGFGRFLIDEVRQTERFVGILFDSSDLKQAELAQRQSEDQLRMASEGGNLGLWYWNMETDTLTWTERAKVMFGLPIDTEMTIQVFLEAIHPDDRPFVQTIVTELQANQPHMETEYRTLWADGTVRWILARGDCDYTADGKLIATRGVFIDITDRKQAEEELHISEERLQLAITSAKLGMWFWDIGTDTLIWTERCKALFGLPLDDAAITYAAFLEVLHPADRDRTHEAVARAIKDRVDYDIEYRAIWQDGTVHWIAAKGSCVYDATGQAIRMNGVVIDIDDRKQAEAEREQLLQREQLLRQQAEVAEAKLQQVLTSIRENFVLLDRNWHIAYLNAQAAHSMEVPREEALGKSIWDLFPDLVGTEFYDRLHQVMHDRTPLQFEYYYSTWDRWFENRLYPTSEGIVNLSTNITKRKRAELNEQFLNQLDARLRQLSDADAMVWEVVSSLGRYLNVDRSVWSEVDAAANLAIVKQDWYEQNDMSSVIGVYQLSDFALPSLNNSYHMGQTVVVADVSTHPCTMPFVDNYIPYGTRAYVAVPCVAEGSWVALLVINAKVPRNWRSDEVALLQEMVARLWSLIEHTRAIQELRESEAEFRQLANAMPQIVWVADADGNIEFANDRWTEYTRFSLEQSRNQVLKEQLIPLEDRERLRTDFIQAQAARSLYESQFRLIQPDGSYCHFLTRAVPILDEQGKVHKWYGTSTDISDRVQLEHDRERILQQEQAAREAAETANRIKDEFLAVLSHELRSPLNPILGWSKLLQHGKLDATRTKTALTTIERNAQLQVQLIDDLLDISRILRGKLSLDQGLVDLCSVIWSALETVRLAAEAKSLNIQTILVPNAGKVLGDAGRLQQVVWNLLSNAVKFTPQGGQITIALTQTDTDVHIQVTDTGKGINPEFVPYVFEHFRQEDGATTRKFGGLGLGMAIARQIVELHGGTVAVESPGEGQGATFIVHLPVAPDLSELPSSEVFSLSKSDLNGTRILVVDDETDSREFVAFVLEQAGAMVTSVSAGIEALQVIEQIAPDVILSDIGMPEMDGYMLLQQIRRQESSKQVPAIALTAYAGEFDRQQALQAGFHCHLAKPVEPEVLVAAIVKLLA